MSERIDEYALQDLTTSDKLFGVNASGNTRQYTPGTAASSDVQTSSTDTTADRLMAVGAFGLGNITNAPSIVASDTEIASGLYRSDGDGSTDPAESATAKYAVLHFRRVSGGGEFQYWAEDVQALPKVWVRNRLTGSWRSFYQVTTSADYPSDSAWTTTTSLDNGWTGTIWYIKRLGFVSISVAADGSSKTDNAMLTLPSGYRPDETQFPSDNRSNSDVDVLTSGLIRSNSSATSVRFSVTYPVL